MKREDGRGGEERGWRGEEMAEMGHGPRGLMMLMRCTGDGHYLHTLWVLLNLTRGRWREGEERVDCMREYEGRMEKEQKG